MTAQEKRRFYSPALGEFFNRLKMGVVMLYQSPPSLIFANDHFYQMALGKEEDIISFIFQEFASRRDCNEKAYLRLDMEIQEGFTIGFTAYPLSEKECLVFLKDISYKQILLENMGENLFYDRLSRIIGELAHEIGNPLASVGTALQVLQGGMDSWDRMKKNEYIHRAITEMDRLGLYLEKIRDFSTVSPSIRLELLPLLPLLKHVVLQYNSRLEEKGISVTYDAEDSITILVDKIAFHQVLSTLFLNSIEILPVGGTGKIHVEIEMVTDRFVKLVYRNNGPPIPPEVKERIFVPFYATEKESHGIGLAASLKMMIRMGGKIGIEKPETGWGAKFVLYIAVKENDLN